MFLVTTLFGAIVAAFIAYLKYSYRNTIVFTITSIRTSFAIKEGNLHRDDGGGVSRDLTAERFVIENRGWRNLEKVELHVPMRGALIHENVKSTSSISPASVTVEKSGDFAKLSFISLPRSEEVTITTASTSSYEGEFREVRGNSALYRVVEGRRFKINRKFRNLMLWIAFIVFTMNLERVIGFVSGGRITPNTPIADTFK